MGLDRNLQNKILRELEAIYPEVARADKMESYEAPDFTRNAFYLWEHELIDAEEIVENREPKRIFGARITARGLDFLQDDGGIDAILRTMTVKLHRDTISQLLEMKIDASSLPAESKGWFKKSLKNLPAKAIESLVIKLAGLGLDHAPEALRIIETFLNQPS